METLQRDPVKIDLILGRPAEANVEDRRWGQLRLAESNLEAALIDRDQRLDLPTFAASEAQIEAINAAVIDCRGNWPSPKSDRMQKASFTGFPELIRAVRVDRTNIPTLAPGAWVTGSNPFSSASLRYSAIRYSITARAATERSHAQ
jgi:hypothetical protein